MSASGGRAKRERWSRGVLPTRSMTLSATPRVIRLIEANGLQNEIEKSFCRGRHGSPQVLWCQTGQSGCHLTIFTKTGIVTLSEACCFSSPLALSRIKILPQTVADKVEGEHSERNSQSRKDQGMRRRLQCGKIARLFNHHAP